MSTHIHQELTRCLQCQKPLCEQGCPVNTPIKEAINLAKNNRLYEAGELLFNNNPLSIITGLVCPHEDFCEGHCILGKKQSPIDIGSIEYYISEYYLNQISFTPAEKLNRKIAIVGSGPAGLTVAIILARRGYDITIFESHDKIGGVLRFGIPEFRLPKQIIDRYQDLLHQMGVKIRPNTLIGPVLTLQELFRDGYQAIFIATGTLKPKKLDVIGESLGHVFYAIDYLRNPGNHFLGKRLVIIGGGNVAIDAARTALRSGTQEVTVYYRRSEEDMPSSPHEITYAKMDGVKFAFNYTPKEIKDTCVEFVKTRSNPQGQIEAVDGTDICVDADSVIISISQGPQKNIVNSIKSMKQIKLDRFGLIVIDETGKTTLDGVFASGDVVTGAKTVVEAVANAKVAAETIHDYVQSQGK